MWNSLPVIAREPACNINNFKQVLKLFFDAIQMFCDRSGKAAENTYLSA